MSRKIQLPAGERQGSSAVSEAPALPLWLVILGCVVLLYLGSPAMDGTADPDFYWHLEYARKTIAAGAVPTVDFLSWTKGGEPYVLTQWLGQLIVGSAFAAAGSLGTALLTLACVLGVVVLAWRAASLHTSHQVGALAVALLCTSPFWSTYARPQLLGFLAMAALVLVLERSRTSGSRTTLALATITIMVFWVNAHGSYIAGLAYMGLFALSSVVEEVGAGVPRRALARSIRFWALTLLASSAATIINPFGWHAWRAVVEIAGLQSTTSGIIIEWVPTSFGTAIGSTFIFVSLATFFCMLLGRRRTSVGDATLMAGVFIFGMLASRQAFYACIALVPILMRFVDQTALFDLVRQQLRAQVGLFVALLALVACTAAGQYWNGYREAALASWKKRVFPVEAAEYLNRTLLQGRLFNEATSGGFLAHATGRKVYIDGRLDLFRDPEFFGWFFLRQGNPEWSRQVRETGADVFVLQQQSPLTQLLLTSPAYGLVHSDRSYVVIVDRHRHPDLQVLDPGTRPPFKIFDAKGNLRVTPLGY